MFQNMAKSMTEFYIGRGLIDAQRRASYEYGFQLLLSALLHFLLLLSAALLLGLLPEALAFMAAFLLIRWSCGGYHAGSHARCVTLFVCVFLAFTLGLAFLPQVLTGVYVLVATLISGFFISRYAPVENEKNPLREEKKEKFRTLALTIGALFAFLALVCYCFGPSAWMLYAFSGELAAAASMAIAANKK